MNFTNIYELAEHIKENEKYKESIGFSVNKNYFISKKVDKDNKPDGDKMCWVIYKNEGGSPPAEKIDSYYWNYHKAQEEYD